MALTRITVVVLLVVVVGLYHVDLAVAGYRQLDPNYSISWEYNSTSITFTLMANASGWIGFGFSPNGAMAGSDVVIAFVNSNGSVVLQDRHATGELLPSLDTIQNYVLLSGQRSNGQLTVTFTRLLDTCDSEDAVITPYTTKVIYSYGDLDATGTPTYHGPVHRGAYSMLLLNAEPAQANDTGVFYIDPVPQLVTVPANSTTTYWCSIVRLPATQNKSHIIGIEPVIWTNNTDIVHHILVYGCNSPNLNFTSYDCFFNPAGDGGNGILCQSLIGMWAVGALAYSIPSEAGIPIGGGYGPDFVLIQTHYNNPGAQAGRTDASRLRFKVTPTLREYDAGIIQTGVINGIFVPPNTASMNVAGYCSDNVLSSLNMPVTGIKVFAVALHSHLLGRAISLRQFRQQQQLPVITADPNYDFNYQDIRALSNYIQILPGDILQTVCTYSSLARGVATLGGRTTMQEMCLSYVFYYPRTNISLCQTAPVFVVNGADPLYNMIKRDFSFFNWILGNYSNLDNVIWTSDIVAQIQAGYFFKSIDMWVVNSAGHKEWDPPRIVSDPLATYTTSSSCSQTTAVISSAIPAKSGMSRITASIYSNIMLVLVYFFCILSASV